MPKQLMKRHNQGQRFLCILNIYVCCFLVEEHDIVCLGFGIDIAKVYILESFILSDIIIIRDVDTNGSARACECNNLK